LELSSDSFGGRLRLRIKTNSPLDLAKEKAVCFGTSRQCWRRGRLRQESGRALQRLAVSRPVLLREEEASEALECFLLEAEACACQLVELVHGFLKGGGGDEEVGLRGLAAAVRDQEPGHSLAVLGSGDRRVLDGHLVDRVHHEQGVHEGQPVGGLVVRADGHAVQLAQEEDRFLRLVQLVDRSPQLAGGDQEVAEEPARLQILGLVLDAKTRRPSAFRAEHPEPGEVPIVVVAGQADEAGSPDPHLPERVEPLDHALEQHHVLRPVALGDGESLQTPKPHHLLDGRGRAALAHSRQKTCRTQIGEVGEKVLRKQLAQFPQASPQFVRSEGDLVRTRAETLVVDFVLQHHRDRAVFAGDEAADGVVLPSGAALFSQRDQPAIQLFLKEREAVLDGHRFRCHAFMLRLVFAVLCLVFAPLHLVKLRFVIMPHFARLVNFWKKEIGCGTGFCMI
jgi:hypothetical protein